MSDAILWTLLFGIPLVIALVWTSRHPRTSRQGGTALLIALGLPTASLLVFAVWFSDRAG